MMMDDKTLDRIIKAVLMVADYDLGKSVYGGGSRSSAKADQRDTQAMLRTAVRKHLPKSMGYSGRVISIDRGGRVMIHLDDKHYLLPGTPVMVDVHGEHGLDELASRLGDEQWAELATKEMRSSPLAKALLKKHRHRTRSR